MARRVGYGDRYKSEAGKPGRPDAPDENAEGWSAYLDDGEKVIWTGQPVRGLSFKPSDIVMSGFGLVFFSFAVFWTFMASSIGGGADVIGAIFPLFGLPFILVGAYLMFGRFFWDAYVRSKTRYALTDKRAIIAKSALKRSLSSYPITASSPLEFERGPPDTVNFATRFVRTKNGGYDTPVGFERIMDGGEVYKLIRGIRQG